VFGPGGIGKTRLALAVAQELREHFLHGTAFVSLEAVDAASNVISTIGAAFHFSFRGAGDAVTQLGNFFQDKELLLVLDNFEQVVDAAKELAQLLQLAPELKILVTSRTRLALQAERVFEVRGLAYARGQDLTGFQAARDIPSERVENLSGLDGARGQDLTGFQTAASEHRARVENLSGLDATQLFLERARRISPAFAWNDENANSVARICRAVEGMPLALELAAGLTRGAACEQIAAQLEHALGALDSDLRDVSARHRSTRAVFEQSWRALKERERDTLKKLAVFRGGFEAEAAREIANADSVTLAALVDQALVYRADETRFDLHALVREFAGEHLSAANDVDTARTRHAKFFGEFLAARAARIIGATQIETLREVRGEYDNARVAWQWSIAQLDVEMLDRAAPVLYRYHEAQSLYQQAETLFAPAAEISRVAQARLGATFYFLGKLEDARRELNEALTQAQNANDSSESVFCLLQIGNVTFEAGDMKEGEFKYLECLAFARQTNDFYLMTDASNNLAVLTARRGETARAREFCQQAIDAAAQIDEKRGIAGALVNLAMVEYNAGNFLDSRAALERAQPLFQAAGDQRGVNMTLANLGELAREAGEWERAEELYRRALKGYQEIGQPEKVAGQYRNLGDIAMQRAGYAEARRLFRDALAVYERIGSRYWEAYTHLSLGEVARATQDAARAHQEFEKALQLALAIDALPRALDALMGLARVEESKREFSRAVERAAFVAAHASTDQPTRSAAQNFLKTLAGGIDARVFEGAREAGEAADFFARVK